MDARISPQAYRETLGQYPTGVTVVTAIDPTGNPIGMTVGSFTSVSLDPPLVAFLPSTSSSSWRQLRESGATFCVNILSADQEDVCRAVSTRKSDKFDGIAWSPGAAGNPVLDGVVASIDCTVETVHDAGDHQIVIGRVLDLGIRSTAYPLLFFRGGYGSFHPQSLASGDSDLVEQLTLIDLVREHLDALASRLSTEVTATTLVTDELVLAAASGRAGNAVLPTRVGARIPFAPPVGSVYAAWGDTELRARWLANVDSDVSEGELAELRAVPDRVRERGFAILLGHQRAAGMERALGASTDPQVRRERLRPILRDLWSSYNPRNYDGRSGYELRSIQVPVFGPGDAVAFILTLWGPPGVVTRGTVDLFVEEAKATATACTRAIQGAGRLESLSM